MHLRIKKSMILASTKLRLRKAFVRKAADVTPEELKKELIELEKKLKQALLTYAEDGSLSPESKITKVPEKVYAELEKKLETLKRKLERKKVVNESELNELKASFEEALPSWQDACTFIKKSGDFYIVKLKPHYILSTNELTLDELEGVIKKLGGDYSYIKSSRKMFGNINNLDSIYELSKDDGNIGSSIRLVVNSGVTTSEKLKTAISTEAKIKTDDLFLTLAKDVKRKNQNERGMYALISAKGNLKNNLIIDGFQVIKALNDNCFKVANKTIKGPYGILKITDNSVIFAGGGLDKDLSDGRFTFKEVVDGAEWMKDGGKPGPGFFIVSKQDGTQNILKTPAGTKEFTFVPSEIKSSDGTKVKIESFVEIKDFNEKGITEVKINKEDQIAQKFQIDDKGTFTPVGTTSTEELISTEDLISKEELETRTKLKEKIKSVAEDLDTEKEIDKESDKFAVLSYDLDDLNKKLKKEFGESYNRDTKEFEKILDKKSLKTEQYVNERKKLIEAVNSKQCFYCTVENILDEKTDMKPIYDISKVLEKEFKVTARTHPHKKESTSKLRISSASLNFLRLAEEEEEHAYLKFLKKLAVDTVPDFKDMLKKGELGGKLYEINKSITQLLDEASQVKNASTKLRIATSNDTTVVIETETPKSLLKYFIEEYPKKAKKLEKEENKYTIDLTLLAYITVEDVGELTKYTTFEKSTVSSIFNIVYKKSKKDSTVEKNGGRNFFKCVVKFNSKIFKNDKDDPEKIKKEITDEVFVNSGLKKLLSGKDQSLSVIINSIEKFEYKSEEGFSIKLELLKNKNEIMKDLFEQNELYGYKNLKTPETASTEMDRIKIKLPENLVKLFNNTRKIQSEKAKGKFFFCYEHLKNYIETEKEEKSRSKLVKKYIEMVTKSSQEGYETYSEIKKILDDEKDEKDEKEAEKTNQQPPVKPAT